MKVLLILLLLTGCATHHPIGKAYQLKLNLKTGAIWDVQEIPIEDDSAI